MHTHGTTQIRSSVKSLSIIMPSLERHSCFLYCMPDVNLRKVVSCLLIGCQRGDMFSLYYVVSIKQGINNINNFDLL